METVSDLGEFGLIGRISALLPAKSRELLVGIGDDAAAFLTAEGRCLLLTTDALVEGVHFRREWGTWQQVGNKAMAASLSDIAAMGGKPLLALVGLAVGADTPVSVVEEVYAGMVQVAKKVGVEICGGDTVRSPSGVLLCVTVLGECLGARPTLRSGAKAGDLLLVTGSLGSSRAGLALLSAECRVQSGECGAVTSKPANRNLKLETAAVEEALKAHLEAQARWREGVALGEAGLANSMIDISDGLLADLGHICSASGVGAEVESQAVPVSRPCQAVAGALGEDPLAWALEGGEDYELLFTCSPDKAEEARELVHSATGAKVTAIGRMTEAEGIVVHSYEPSGGPGGYRHF